MPILAAGEFLALVVAIAISYLVRLLILTLVIAILSRIPGIGGIIQNKAYAVVDTVDRKLWEWLNASIQTLVSWFAVLATRVVAFPGAVEQFAFDVRDTIRHLVETGIASIVHAATADLRNKLEAARTHINDLTRLVNATPAYVEKRIGEVQHALSNTLLEQFQKGIDRLYKDTIEPEIVGIEQGVKVLDRGLDAARTEAAQAARTVSGEIGALARRLDIPLSVVEGLIAAVGVTAAVAALEALSECHPKLRMMCSTDPMALADLFAGLVMLAAWPGLYELTKDTQELLGGIAGEIETMALHGLTL